MFKKLFGAAGVWKSSAYSDLPEVWIDAPETVSHFLVIAGGLSLLLSRASEKEVNSRLINARHLHSLLRRELKQHRRSSATGELLIEVLHECGHLVDSATKESLKACLEARRLYDAERRSSAAGPSVWSQPSLAPSSVVTPDSGSNLNSGSGSTPGRLNSPSAPQSRAQIDRARPGSS